MSKTHEQFCKEVNELYNGEYSILGQYKNCETLILVQHNCKDCNNHTWEITPNNLLRGHTCPKCSYVKRANNAFNKSKKNFYKEFNNKFKKEYILLSEYNGTHDYIYVEHNSDLCNHYIWKVKPSDILNGHKCPICANKINGINKRRTQEQFEKEVYDLVGDEYTVLGKYKNSRQYNKILMRHNCDKCNNYEWEVNTLNFLHRNSRCPQCYGNIPYTTETFKQKVFELEQNNYLVLGNYVNNKNKILMKHNIKKCGYEWEISPHSFLIGTRCPICNESKGEGNIYKILLNKNVTFERQYIFNDCRDKNPLPFDFAIFEDEGKVN